MTYLLDVLDTFSIPYTGVKRSSQTAMPPQQEYLYGRITNVDLETGIASLNIDLHFNLIDRPKLLLPPHP